jgi:adhesin transport system membrane fusion protein
MIASHILPGDDPLRGPRRGVLALLITMAGALAGFVVWSNVTMIDISAVGFGRIVPSRQVQVVQNLEGGIVKEVLVRAGDRVVEGQVLARIGDAEFSATYREGQVSANGLRALIARLTAEASGGEPQFPASVRSTSPDLLAKELSLFNSRKAELESTIESIRETASRARNTIGRARENLPILRQSLALAREQRGIVEPQVTKGLISRVELLSAQQRILELETKINESRREIPAAESVIAESTQRIEATRQKFRADALRQLTEAKVKLSGLSEVISAQKDRVDRREVTSPVKGVVKAVTVTTVGQVVKPGESLLEIVPTDDQLVVEARFSPKDIAFLQPGQKAFIRVTAYDSSIYGAMLAKVTDISADATVTEQDEVYYVVRAQAVEGFEGADKDLPLMPGMVAQVDVVTGKRTVFDYIVKPITNLKYTSMHER